VDGRRNRGDTGEEEMSVRAYVVGLRSHRDRGHLMGEMIVKEAW
jgi:hypothetical protein